jgi:putative ABC transport system ATP-binding protein
MVAGDLAPPARPLLALERAARTFPGNPPVHALSDANFALVAGEMVAVVGRSGSGKSTLMNLLGLLDTATAGRYLVAGHDVSTLAEREVTALRSHFFGFVFQQAYLLASRTARENVELTLVPHGFGKRERRARALEALSEVGLAERAEAFPNTLSGGEAQRVAIARAVVQHPAVLLCDEPTGNLDSATAGQIVALLQRLNHGGMTVVVVTHDLSLARALPRHVTVKDGCLTDRTNVVAATVPC